MNISILIRPAGSVTFTERKALIDWSSVDKEDVLTSQTDTLAFTMKIPATAAYGPTVGDEVKMYDGATQIFGGFITYINQRIDGAGLFYYDCSCKDYTHLLDGVLIKSTYNTQSINAIIADIINQVNVFTTPFGVTYTTVNVNCPLVIDHIQFNYEQATKCLQQLAETYIYHWYVDYAKDIHFFANAAEVAPFNLTDNSGNYIFNSLEISHDITQLRNYVFVRGGKYKTTASRTETYVATAGQTSQPLANDYATTPIVKINGVTQSVGIDGTDSPLTFQVLWNANLQSITFSSALSSGQTITIAAQPQFPVLALQKDNPSIASYGTFQYKIIDKRINTVPHARDRAQAEIQNWGDPLIEGTFKTYRSGLRSGQLISIQSTIRGINIAIFYVVQKVVLKMFSQSDGIWQVDFVSVFGI
jgi:hypothetical protein